MLLIFQRLEDIEAIDVCLHGCMHLHPYLSWPSFYFLIKTISTKCMLSLSSPQNEIVIIQWELFLIILQSKVVQTLDNLTNTTPFKKRQNQMLNTTWRVWSEGQHSERWRTERTELELVWQEISSRNISQSSSESFTFSNFTVNTKSLFLANN